MAAAPGPSQGVSGSHWSCSYQETGGGTDGDEDQYPEVAPKGEVYIHLFNNQNQAAWEVDLDSPIMVTKSTNGGESFGQPVPTVQLEDGLSDMPFAVISRQTV